MTLFDGLDIQLVNYLIIPVLIILSRICDVTIGTIRIIFVSRGEKALATFMGFFEVFIWTIVAAQVFNENSQLIHYAAYSAGFAIGTFLGMSIEQKLAMGMVSLRVITEIGADELSDHIRQEYSGVTTMAARGMSGEVKLLFAIIKRKDIDRFVKLVKNYNPNAYISIEDVRTVSNTHLPHYTAVDKKIQHRRFSLVQKRK